MLLADFPKTKVCRGTICTSARPLETTVVVESPAGTRTPLSSTIVVVELPTGTQNPRPSGASPSTEQQRKGTDPRTGALKTKGESARVSGLRPVLVSLYIRRPLLLRPLLFLHVCAGDLLLTAIVPTFVLEDDDIFLSGARCVQLSCYMFAQPSLPHARMQICLVSLQEGRDRFDVSISPNMKATFSHPIYSVLLCTERGQNMRSYHCRRSYSLVLMCSLPAGSGSH